MSEAALGAWFVVTLTACFGNSWPGQMLVLGVVAASFDKLWPRALLLLPVAVYFLICFSFTVGAGLGSVILDACG